MVLRKVSTSSLDRAESGLSRGLVGVHDDAARCCPGVREPQRGRRDTVGKQTLAAAEDDRECDQAVGVDEAVTHQVSGQAAAAVDLQFAAGLWIPPSMVTKVVAVSRMVAPGFQRRARPAGLTLATNSPRQNRHTRANWAISDQGDDRACARIAPARGLARNHA